jgi:hypothetical protein
LPDNFFMAQNTLPSDADELMQMAETMANGLERHGQWLRTMEMQAVEFRETLETLRRNQAAFSTFRNEKAAAGKWVSAADEAITEWLGKARLAVMLARGQKWSVAWLDAGFAHGSTDVPKAMAPRIELTQKAVDFFARNPQFGVAHANVTATYGRKVYENAVSAQRVRQQLVSECINAKRIRDEAEQDLRRKMGRVVRMLSASIKPNDARWFAFGLKQPRTEEPEESASAPEPTFPIAHLSSVQSEPAVTAAA